MKNFLMMIGIVLFCSSLYGQQLPLTESCFVNRYALSSAYAGNSENESLFASYRMDWSGISDAPRTIRLSYHDGFRSNTGLGGKVAMDRFGIFQRFFAMGTYSYRLRLFKESDQFLLFGLSAGVNQNSIKFDEYYNDPKFTNDPSMINKRRNSNVTLISDFSTVYTYQKLQVGLLLSNIGISDSRYSAVKTVYSPFMHYQLHAIHTLSLGDDWQFTPLAVLRGGKNVKAQLEVASQFKYNNKLWGSIAHRGKNVSCVGFGLNMTKGVLLNYTYNFFTGVSVSAFQNHELTLGLNIGEFIR